ncbi:bacterio-opsin activator domain-containing protein [Halomicrococcus sp. SG-WS-1]|uniref:bacterio-opsin activator domain-containing protein n=1 Tax=Halomicrococcus sp. SG-WS-1 TaxID=3439057 RepID=UPI003F79F7CF
MDRTPLPRTSVGDIEILLVGPDAWQQTVRPAFDDSATVVTESVRTGEQAMTAVTDETRTVDCVVSAERLDDGTGLDLLHEMRARAIPTAFVLAPRESSESLARRAVERDVADYVPVDTSPDGLQRRCRQAVQRRRAERRRSAEASQFEAFFTDPSRFVAVLDPDGTVRRVNDAGLGYLGLSEQAVLGKRFWALPWADSHTSRRQVQRAVRDARTGTYTEFEASLAGDEAKFEFTVRPVGDGDVSSLVVEGHDLEERARLEEELRESEELHRVTLNNMTDTVLITDDQGEFTYVCPNVHFIFGYSVEEIYEFGTIDALLGEDLFDRATLESESVLTNIECTATDKDGRDHTLLVNVRTVSIQGGTTLYSCRDITKRKKREEALTQLHQTSRDLLYAETYPEIADRVVTDAKSILPTAATAVYQFDREENVLAPTRVAEELASLLGTLPAVSLDQTNAVERAFVGEETQRPADAAWDDRGLSPLSGLDDYIAVPLGGHGVFVAAAADADVFDAVSEEITELLAATTEAAFDRVERETELRERDRALQEQNRRLSRLNRVNEFIREIDQALVRAETRTTIEEAVCQQLTTDDRFSFAWVSETTASNGTLQARTWAGDEQGYLDSVSLTRDADPDGGEPTVRAAERREATYVSNVADHLRSEEWCKEAVSRGFQSVFAIPLVYDDVLFGTVGVYAGRPDAFDEMSRSVLRELGNTVASAINAVQRKEALQSDTVVELEYTIPGSSTVLGRLADAANSSITVEGSVRRDDETTLVFARVDDGAVEAVVDAAAELVGVSGANVLQSTDDGGLVGLRVLDPFVTTVLADHGAVLRYFEATPRDVRATIAVPESVPIRSIDEVITNLYDAAELVAQRTEPQTPGRASLSDDVLEELTDRQREVARMAYHSGFFDADRDVTGRDVAAMLDISHTAFYDHVRRIQRKLFVSLFERPSTPGDVE